MSKLSSKSPKYRLGKNILQSTVISKTFNIQNSETQQIWKAKVFDLTKIDEHNMLNVLQYNQEVFTFLKNKYQNSLYLEKTFQKDSKQFLVYEYWSERLSTYIEKHPDGIKDQVEVKRILQDVLISICDIYAEEYMVLNLRPEQIVRVLEPTENSLGWKIESLVFQYTSYDLPQKCEYEFDYEWASNEEKTERQNLDELLKDEQIVWYMGVIALRLIYGPKFVIRKTFKDSDLNINELKKMCLPQVFQLIEKSVKSNLRDRIPLKKFLNLPVFSQIEISNEVKQKFITGNSDRIKKSFIMKNSILQKSLNRKNSELFKMTVSLQIHQMTPLKDNSLKGMKNSGKIMLLSEVSAQKIFNSLRWMIQKCLYLAEVKDYTQTTASLSETSVEDKTLIRYLYFKIAEINLNKFEEICQNDPNLKAFKQSANSKDLYQDLVREIEQNVKSKEMKSIFDESVEYENKMKKLDPKQLKLLKDFQHIALNLKKNIQNKNINIQELTDSFKIINGKFFESLKKLIQTSYGLQNRGIKVRALCYFIISSYVILVKPSIENGQEELTTLLMQDFSIYKKKFYDHKRLEGSIPVNLAEQIEYIRLCEFTKSVKQDILIENSKEILKKYFQTVQTNHKALPVPEKQNHIRTSLSVYGKKRN